MSYTEKEYADKAVEATSKGEMLYIIVTEEPYDVEVPVFETVQEEQEQIKLDENGMFIPDDDGNPVMETVTVNIEKPVMIEKEVPIFDENGEQTGTNTILVQQTRTETLMREVENLVIAPAGYYICYKDNYTHGEINEEYEAEQAEKERQRLNLLNLTKADVLLALYQDKGITPEDIKAMLKDNVPALIKFDYASSYYRGDEVVNALGLALGYTTEQMDYLYENKAFPPKVEEPADTDSDNDSDTDSDTDTDNDTEQAEEEDENTTDTDTNTVPDEVEQPSDTTENTDTDNAG